MIIVSQEQNEILNFNNIMNIQVTNCEEDGYLISAGFIVGRDDNYRDLGYYKTEERAKEVLAEIVQKYSSYLQLKVATRQVINFIKRYQKSDYETICLENNELKEKNERLESENQEFLYKYGNILKENEKLKEYKKIAELTKISCCIAQNCEALNNAIKKELENQRLEKENETLKKLHIQDNNKLDFVMKHCILEQKIKDKIEELNKKEQKLQNSISAEEREEYSDANISWDLMDINIKREVLQDLIEGRK